MMSEIRAFVTLAALVAVGACDPGSARVAVDEVAPARPQLAGMVVTAKAPTLKVHKIAAPVAEDGNGHRVTAPADPRALDLIAPSWPGRALDPVLHIGDLHFHQYRFESREIMRYVVDDAARLPAGAEVWLQWGNDESSRIVITPSLEVAR